MLISKESSFAIPLIDIDVVRQINNFGQVGRRAISMISGTLMDIEFSL